MGTPDKRAFEEESERVAELESRTRSLVWVITLGQRLAGVRGLAPLTDALSSVVSEQLGAELVSFSTASLSPAGEALRAGGAGEPAGDHAEAESFSLVWAGAAVGELRIRGLSASSREQLELLLPWAALATGNALVFEEARLAQEALGEESERRTQAEAALAALRAERRRPTLEQLAQRWGLSDRQAELLARTLRGEDAVEAAANMGLSESTVQNHLAVLYKKAGVSGRSALLALCLTPTAG